MGILKSVLEEELERNIRNQNLYKERLGGLPKGSIFISNRNGKKYMYRKYREGNKVINKYICALSDIEKTKEERKKSEDYIRISKNLKIAKKEELRLRKALKAYEQNL